MTEDRAATMADLNALLKAVGASVAKAIPVIVTKMCQTPLDDLATEVAALSKRVERLDPTPDPPPPESKL